MSIRSWLKLLTKSNRATRPVRATPPPDDPAADYAVRDDWSGSEGEINYSSFVYFDVDRDGRYGISDRPFGAIMVRLRKDNKFIASSRTNNNGFANFKSSATKDEASICSAGVYEFVVSVPSGFTVTSRNEIQSGEFQPRPGSISGIGADEMVQPVGLAPNRTIRGRLPHNARLTVKALGRGADTGEYHNQTAFHYSVPPDVDLVEFSMADYTRLVRVSGYPIDLGLIEPDRGALNPNHKIETVDFEGINPRGLRKIPSGYAGLNWFNLNAIARDFTKSSQGYVNGNTSGNYVAYTSSGYPALIYSDRPFDFVGIYLSVAWLQAEGEIGIIESWRGDELVSKDSVKLSALTPVFYNPCLPGITRIRLATQHSWQMVLDDLIIAR